MVRTPQPIERVAGRGERRVIDHQTLGTGPRRRNDPAGFDQQVTAQRIRSGAGDSDASFDRGGNRPPRAVAGSAADATRRFLTGRTSRRRRIEQRIGRVRDRVVGDRDLLLAAVVPALAHLGRGVVFPAAVCACDRHRLDPTDSHLGAHTCSIDLRGRLRLMVDQLVLVRHGETEWSVERRHTGRTDVQLTQQGRSEATHIRDTLTRFDFTAVFSSPLSRALETAQLAGLDPAIDADLVEWDYGRYEGITTAEIRTSLPNWSVWTAPIPDGESLEEVAERTDRVIERVLPLDGTVALVAHAHLLRVLGARWLELDPVEGRRLVLDTGTMSVLGWERENRVIQRWNDPCGG